MEKSVTYGEDWLLQCFPPASTLLSGPDHLGIADVRMSPIFSLVSLHGLISKNGELVGVQRVFALVDSNQLAMVDPDSKVSIWGVYILV